MADKVSGRRPWPRHGVARLLPPLLLAVFVIAPPQSLHTRIVEQLRFRRLVGRVLRPTTSPPAESGARHHGRITPTYNHMWFVAYLLVYSLILAGLLALVGVDGSRQAAGGASSGPCAAGACSPGRCSSTGGDPAGAGPRFFEITHALVDDWYNHAPVSRRLPVRLPDRQVAAGGEAGLHPLGAGPRLAWRSSATAPMRACAGSIGMAESRPGRVREVGFVIDQWCAIAAVLGFGARHPTRGGPVLTLSATSASSLLHRPPDRGSWRPPTIWPSSACRRAWRRSP